jgi:hypothetical protein
VLLTPILRSPILVTLIRLLLIDLLPLVLLALILLGRRTKSLVHGLIGRQLRAFLGVVKSPISASLCRPLNEVPCKQKI